jgi:hypothetical protein
MDKPTGILSKTTVIVVSLVVMMLMLPYVSALAEELDAAKIRAALEKELLNPEPVSEIEAYDEKDELIEPQGNETGSNTWYGEGARNITGGRNSCFGKDACGSINLSGTSNTFVGVDTGTSTTTGNHNTFIGDYAGGDNTSGDNNTSLGDMAGYGNDLGDNNTYIGKSAGLNNNGSNNVIMGYEAGIASGSGTGNVFVGYQAGIKMGNGIANTFVGTSAGPANTGGSTNVFLGWGAGYSSVTGSGNVMIGSLAGLGETGSNKLYIGPGNTPLIYGEFDNGIVAVDGSLGVRTHAPNRDLVVKYDSTAGGLPYLPAVSVQNTHVSTDVNDYSFSSFEFSSNNGGVVGEFFADGSGYFLNGTPNVYFRASTNHPIILGTNNTVRMIITNTGRVGIGTTNPSASYKLHVAGAVAGTSWNNLSSRDYKEDIRKVDESAHPMMLAKVMDMDLTTYKYKKEYGGEGDTKLGFIAEDMPDEVLSKDKKGVDIYELVTLMTGAMKAQQKEISEQQKTIERLSKEVAELKRNMN